MSVGDEHHSHKEGVSAMLGCKLENDIGSGGVESQTEPKVIEVGGVTEETGRTMAAQDIVNFIFKGGDKVPCWSRRRRWIEERNEEEVTVSFWFESENGIFDGWESGWAAEIDAEKGRKDPKQNASSSQQHLYQFQVPDIRGQKVLPFCQFFTYRTRLVSNSFILLSFRLK